MTVIYPEATPAQGNTSVKVVLTIANPSAPTAAEVNHASALDISCFLRDWNPEMQSSTVTAPNRLCSGVQLPVEGRTQFNPIQVRYVYDPQAADAADDNKAKALLVRGTEFYAVVRKGLDAQSAAYAAGQRVEVWRFRCGRQNFVRSGDDEAGEFEVSQQLFPLAEPIYAVIAA